MSSVFVASTAVAAAPGFSWEVTGDEGALEVPAHLADEILAIPQTCFYTVDSPVISAGVEIVSSTEVESEEENGDAENNVEEVTTKPRARAKKVTKEETPSDEE